MTKDRAKSLATYMVWRLEEEVQEDDPEFILDGKTFNKLRDSIQELLENMLDEV